LPLVMDQRRAKPRLYGSVCVVSFNHEDGVDMVGHDYIAVEGPFS
jgi:hypothetical protein